jgi:hypothetical protein
MSSVICAANQKENVSQMASLISEGKRLTGNAEC